MNGSTKPETAPESGALRQMLRLMGSIRITVFLMASSMFLVLGGTLAQAGANGSSIETVVTEIFRCWFAKIHIHTFLPDAFIEARQPETQRFLMRFFIPWLGGISIGLLLFFNLLAAHLLRWKVTARAGRLLAGLAVLGLAIGLGLLVIQGGLMDLIGRLLTGVAAVFGRQSTLDDSFWRVLDRLAQGLLVAAVVYAALRLLYGKAKAGVVMIHSSVLLLLLAELLTHLGAVEARMTLREGESADFVDRSNRFELAIIEDLADGQARSTVIPQALLAGKSEIDLPELGLRLAPQMWFPNSDLRSGSTPGVDAGAGKELLIVGLPENNGVSSISNAPACLVKFSAKDGSPLGLYAFSSLFYGNFIARQNPDLYQELQCGGRKFRLMLRNEREYLENEEGRMSIALRDFHIERFMGSQDKMSYSSMIDIRMPGESAPEHGEIWMNHPLRRLGRTFYQSGFLSSEDGTILQVVKNGGWMIPYISCMIAALGMFIHFVSLLLKHLRRPGPGGQE
ncbi:MAG: hypothetical protein RL095_3896 [Verrucomicrobiota bacterium]|jgi:hypothetical protein